MNLSTSSFRPSTRLLSNSGLISPPLRVSMAAAGFSAAPFPFCPRPFLSIPKMPLATAAKKKNLQAEPVLNPSILEEVSVVGDEDGGGGEDDIFDEGFEDGEKVTILIRGEIQETYHHYTDELVEDDGQFGDEYFAEEAEAFAGDGAGGGGISLSGTVWDKKVYEIAEEVTVSFDGELGIYAFRTLPNAAIQVRIERLTNKSGSPNMTDIEDFTTRYRARLDEVEATGSIPGSITIEVSSPGVERIVRIPQDLERFKDRNLFVKYVDAGSSSEKDGVFTLVSYDSDASSCTWGLANVRLNRERSGKGRPLSKKQKEWRLNTPLDSLRLVRLYSEM